MKFYKCAPNTNAKSMMSNAIPAMRLPYPTVVVTVRHMQLNSRPQRPANRHHRQVTVSTQTGTHTNEKGNGLNAGTDAILIGSGLK